MINLGKSAIQINLDDGTLMVIGDIYLDMGKTKVSLSEADNFQCNDVLPESPLVARKMGNFGL